MTTLQNTGKFRSFRTDTKNDQNQEGNASGYLNLI